MKKVRVACHIYCRKVRGHYEMNDNIMGFAVKLIRAEGHQRKLLAVRGCLNEHFNLPF